MLFPTLAGQLVWTHQSNPHPRMYIHDSHETKWLTTNIRISCPCKVVAPGKIHVTGRWHKCHRYNVEHPCKRANGREGKITCFLLWRFLCQALQHKLESAMRFGLSVCKYKKGQWRGQARMISSLLMCTNLPVLGTFPTCFSVLAFWLERSSMYVKYRRTCKHTQNSSCH